MILTSLLAIAYKDHFVPVAEITFDTKVISFDTIMAGEKVIKGFSFTNTGNATLRINTVQASDGGTIGYWPEYDIEPGKKDTIRIEFGFTHSRHGFQDKTFTVISHATNDAVVLHLKGYIKNN